MGVNCGGDIFEACAHFESKCKTRREFGQLCAYGLNADHRVIAFAPDHSDKTVFAFAGHGAAVGGEGEVA